MLTPEDHALIADAVREGMRSDPVPWHRIVLHLSLAVAALGLAVWVYGLLQDWRMPTQVSLTTSSRQAPKHMSWRGLPGQIDWDLTAEGEVHISARASNEFDPSDPDSIGEVDVVLPIDADECARIAAQLGGTCAGNVLRIREIEVTFSTQVQLDTSKTCTRSESGAIESCGPNQPTSVEASFGRTAWIGVQSNNALTTRFYAARRTTTFLQGAQPLDPFSVRKPPLAPPPAELRLFEDDPHSSVHIHLRPVPPHPLIVTIDTSAPNIWLEARAPVESVENFSGVLTTSDGGRRVVEPPAHLLIGGDASDAPNLRLFFDPGRSLLSADPAPVTSVLVDREELVTPVWERYSAIVVPIWSGLLGVLVLSQFATAFRGIWSRSGAKPRHAIGATSASSSATRTQRPSQ